MRRRSTGCHVHHGRLNRNRSRRPCHPSVGQRLPQYFGCGISVANYASSGGLTECNPCARTISASTTTPSWWPAIKLLLKANDIVLIEFGHNDKQTQQTPFETYLKKYVDETRAVGPSRCSSLLLLRSSYTGTPHINSVGVNLPREHQSVATANNVPVIDLTARTQAYLIQRGNATGFYNDSAHTTLGEPRPMPSWPPTRSAPRTSSRCGTTCASPDLPGLGAPEILRVGVTSTPSASTLPNPSSKPCATATTRHRDPSSTIATRSTPFSETCRNVGLPVAIERSGNGAHGIDRWRTMRRCFTARRSREPACAATRGLDSTVGTKQCETHSDQDGLQQGVGVKAGKQAVRIPSPLSIILQGRDPVFTERRPAACSVPAASR